MFFASILWLLSYRFISKKKISVRQFPFLNVLVLYFVLSALSNLLRSKLNHHNAENIIGLESYGYSLIWWLLSAFLFAIIYIRTVSKNLKFNKSVNNSLILSFSHENSLLFILKKLYILISIILVILIFLNPFSGSDYGVLSAKDESDLKVGGLLIGGLLLILLTSIVIPLLLVSPLFSISGIIFCVVMMINSGSKGMAGAYIVYIIFYLIKYKHYSPVFKNNNLRKIFIGVSLISIPFIITLANQLRFGDSSIGLLESLMSVVGRFTQQDVASVIFSKDEWRENFRFEYNLGMISSFIPGFIYPGKPLNPAYAINEIYGMGFTAASPSLFGSLLISTYFTFYWPLLVFLAFIIGKIEGIFTSSKKINCLPHFEWYLLYSWISLFEGNFVIWIFQLSVLFVWRKILLFFLMRSTRIRFLNFQSK